MAYMAFTVFMALPNVFGLDIGRVNMLKFRYRTLTQLPIFDRNNMEYPMKEYDVIPFEDGDTKLDHQLVYELIDRLDRHDYANQLT